MANVYGPISDIPPIEVIPGGVISDLEEPGPNEVEVVLRQVLLYKYRNHLLNRTVVRISSRIFFITLIVLSLFLKADFDALIYPILAVEFFLAFLWAEEERLSTAFIQYLEEPLARTSRGLWEDLYIQAISPKYRVPLVILRGEPFWWLALSYFLVAFHRLVA